MNWFKKDVPSRNRTNNHPKAEKEKQKHYGRNVPLGHGTGHQIVALAEDPSFGSNGMVLRPCGMSLLLG
jgi:hypothetical protein